MKGILFLSLLFLSLSASSFEDVELPLDNSKREILLLTSTFSKDVSHIKKGLNIFQSPPNGIDVKKTFQNHAEIILVCAFDPSSKKWAYFSPSAYNPNDAQALSLKYLEPNVKYYVFASKSSNLMIYANMMNEQCLGLLHSGKYNFFVNSIFDNKAAVTQDKSLALQTRYLTNYEKGMYDDTRVALLYPKIHTHLDHKRVYKYGPAIPKIALAFVKEYEGKVFYVYDYKFGKCYKGVFPSIKIPPFPILKELH